MKATMLATDLLRAGSAQVVDRRRHGEHDERAVSADESAPGSADGARSDQGRDVPRRTGGRGDGSLDGHVRAGHRRPIPDHARRDGRVRGSLGRTRARSDKQRRPRARNRAADDRRRDDRRRRTAAARAHRTHSHAETRLPRRRHHHRGQLEFDFRRRLRAAARDRCRGRATPACQPLARDRRSCHPFAASVRVHDRARSARSERCWRNWAGKPTTSTSSKSTKRLRW